MCRFGILKTTTSKASIHSFIYSIYFYIYRPGSFTYLCNPQPRVHPDLQCEV